MSKYVFCDLDNTLLDDNKILSNKNLEAIKNFEANGNHFIICTGRAPFALEKYRIILNSEDVISSNGAVIIINNKVAKCVTLNKHSLDYVINYSIKNNIHIRIFSSDHFYILNRPIDDKTNAVLYDNHQFVNKDNVFDAIKDSEIVKIVMCSDDKDVLNNAFNTIKKECNDVELTYSLNYFLEINQIGQQKGDGIREYCKLKNIDIKDTISIGDNMNDISMFLTTALSACPSNSIEDVKNIVSYISPYSCNEDAIADILENIEHYEK